jgi:glycosyltransferase involved in cell wall biosynthesis
MTSGSSSALPESAGRLRVAFVVPYCGATTYGGASALALAVACALNEVYDVELLTTCATDYETWRNVEPPGHERLAGVHVHRFAVDHPRDRALFERLSRELVYTPDGDLERQERWMRAQGPYSSSLIEYLDVFGTRYAAVVFFSYLYATTYFGLPLVEDRALLVPLAHDEWPLAFSMWERFFTRPRGFVYGSPEESALLAQRFPAAVLSGPVAGIGVHPPQGVEAQRFRAQTGIAEPFLLYLGRIDPAKGCEQLLADYARARAGGERRDLVLIGERHMPLVEAPGVHVLGPVDERTKWDALAACEVFVMPSPYESLSIAMLEAWTQGRPALVNGHADALVGQCRRASGGLWYASADEFTVALETLDESTGRALGESGRRYVADRYGWPRVEAVYRDAIDRIAAG